MPADTQPDPDAAPMEPPTDDEVAADAEAQEQLRQINLIDRMMEQEGAPQEQNNA